MAVKKRSQAAGSRTGKSLKRKASASKQKESRPPGGNKSGQPGSSHRSTAVKASRESKPARKTVKAVKQLQKSGARRPSPTAAARKVRPRAAAAASPPGPSSFSTALKLYETGLRLMHAEKFEKAKATFEAVIRQFPEETELLDRANVLMQACGKRLLEGGRGPRLKTADDYYEIGVAELNRRELDEAFSHLQHALKLAPKGDHVLYALAAASALMNEKAQALEYLGKSIRYRAGNRFLAANDADFESLTGDRDFLKLISNAG